MNTFSRNAAFDRKFHEEIGQLRVGIETVPLHHRAELLAALDNAQEQHEKMQATNRWIGDMVGEIGLVVEHTLFNVDACRRELRELDPTGRYMI